MKVITSVGVVPSVDEVAAAERRYAASRRALAVRIEPTSARRAAELRLEAEVCEAWAEELESGSTLGDSEYQAVLAEIAEVAAGQSVAGGGVRYLIHADRVRSHENRGSQEVTREPVAL